MRYWAGEVFDDQLTGCVPVVVADDDSDPVTGQVNRLQVGRGTARCCLQPDKASPVGDSNISNEWMTD